ncbi:MAG: hypothetical protein ACAI35_00740 [Candidatus Methylacidiphilales bacterium]|nr:hypothetical protein [Candidatus Methylacidiphilales bacterium]
MSIDEILKELPRLNAEETHAILRRIEELDNTASPEMLAAIDEPDASPRENDLSAKEMLQRMKQFRFAE